MNLLGIDVGTGGTRAVVVNERGQVIAAGAGEHAHFTSRQSGWAEQDPRDWWRATQEAIRAVLARGVPAESIGAVGFSGQMHGAVLLDDNGEVLRPAIIWCDQRTGPQCREITETIGAQRLVELTANPALTGFTLPKLLWVREHERQIWARVRTVLLPKDYVRFRLTGERGMDVADASGTLLFDVVHRRWSAEVAQALEVDESLLPPVVESPEVVGGISGEASSATGLKSGTLVVAGAGDQAAGAVGLGVVRPGAVSATIGTSGVVFAATDRPALDPQGRVHTFCHAVPGRWHVMGVTQGAGLSLRWFRDQFGAGADDGRDPYERLCVEAAQVPAGAAGLLWAPYLMGERTPHLDPNARAALVGLTASHTRGHVVRALLEGVAFSLRDTLTIFEQMNVPVASIRLGGGGAHSPVWRQIQAEIYGRTVELPAAEEGAAYGAALLAGVGAGAWPSVDAACDAVIRIASRLEPDPATVEHMDARYCEYRKLYPAMKGIGWA
jgi:xylulokinase